MPRRQHITLLFALAIAAFFGFTYLLTFRGDNGDSYPTVPYKGDVTTNQQILLGENKASKIENATLKAELGRAGWKVLHTTMAKFPDAPSEDDQIALKSYIHLFARLYPCGDCARHFQKLLQKFPPQVKTRSTAAAWACHVHNQVNKRLGKEVFDCSKIGDFYDCGCADDKKGKDGEGDEGKQKEGQEKQEDFKMLELEKEGLTRGG